MMLTAAETLAALLCWGLVMIFIARIICGRWINHLSAYTLVWTASLAFYELRLITYHEVSLEAWLYVFLGWISIYLGTALARLVFPRAQPRAFYNFDVAGLRSAILMLSFGGAVYTIVLARNIVSLLRTEGVLTALIDYSNEIYAMRFGGELSGVLYLNFLPYAGCVLAGIYTAQLARMTLTALLPPLVMLAEGVVSMQRAVMVFGALLFAFAYIASPRSQPLRLTSWQKILALSLVLGAFFLVTVQREGGGEFFENETAMLARTGDAVTVAPVLYLYASAPLPCFSEYLKHPENDGKSLWGRYLFASVYRALAKFGYDTYVPYYQNFYNTPVPVNVGTYLRELHRDFGGSAIAIFPFALGFSIIFFESRRASPYAVILLSYLYLVVAFSIDFNVIGSGVWYFPLPLAALAVYLAKTSWRQKRPRGQYSGGMKEAEKAINLNAPIPGQVDFHATRV